MIEPVRVQLTGEAGTDLPDPDPLAVSLQDPRSPVLRNTSEAPVAVWGFRLIDSSPNPQELHREVLPEPVLLNPNDVLTISGGLTP